MSQTPEQIPAAVRELAEAIRANGDSPSAFAIGCIQARIDNEHVSDAEFRAKVRTVLAALNKATSEPTDTQPKRDPAAGERDPGRRAAWDMIRRTDGLGDVAPGLVPLRLTGGNQ